MSTELRSPEYLRSKFKNGMIPTEQDYASLIQSIVQNINPLAIDVPWSE